MPRTAIVKSSSIRDHGEVRGHLKYIEEKFDLLFLYHVHELS